MLNTFLIVLLCSSCLFTLAESGAIIVTGGSAASSQDLAAKLLESGKNVIFFGENPKHLGWIQKRFSALTANSGGKAGRLVTVVGHAAKPHEASLPFLKAIQEFGGADHVVINSGYAGSEDKTIGTQRNFDLPRDGDNALNEILLLDQRNLEASLNLFRVALLDFRAADSRGVRAKPVLFVSSLATLLSADAMALRPDLSRPNSTFSLGFLPARAALNSLVLASAPLASHSNIRVHGLLAAAYSRQFFPPQQLADPTDADGLAPEQLAFFNPLFPGHVGALADLSAIIVSLLQGHPKFAPGSLVVADHHGVFDAKAYYAAVLSSGLMAAPEVVRDKDGKCIDIASKNPETSKKVGSFLCVNDL